MISPFRAFRIAIRAAAWATPHVQKWSRQRNLNRTEGFRNLECGNWSEAEKHFAVALEEKHHSAKAKVEIMDGLAKAQLAQDRQHDARQTIENAIHIAGKSKNLFLQSKALGTLVDLQLSAADYAGAGKTATEIERLERGLVPPSHPRIALAVRKLGIALRGEGRVPESLAALDRATKFAEKAFGAMHVETGNAYAELGATHADAGNHSEAQLFLRRAVEIHRESVGPTSAEATRDIYRLASSLAESGNLEGAVTEYERLVAVGERQVGGNREERAEAQVRLAALYVESGRMSPARDLLIQSMSILRRTGSSGYLLALQAMACVEEDLGRFEAAEQLRAEAELLSQPAEPIENPA